MLDVDMPNGRHVFLDVDETWGSCHSGSIAEKGRLRHGPLVNHEYFGVVEELRLDFQGV